MHRTKTHYPTLAGNFAGIIVAACLGVMLMGSAPAQATEGRPPIRPSLTDQMVLPLYDATATVVGMAQIADEIDASIQAIETEKERIAAEEAAKHTKTYTSEPVSSSAASFKYNGTIDGYGWHYTWYSSNKAHHRDTNQWVLGDDLIYRTTDGYVVVACVADAEGNAVARGSIVPTPFGEGKVLDSGCDAGTIDVYVGF